MHEIKETCGFLDLNGRFHRTQKEAENANIKIKVYQIEHKLETFHHKLEMEIFQFRSPEDYAIAESFQEYMLEVLCKNILKDSDIFLEIIEEKKALKKELDALRKMEKYQNKWWIKYKWW